MIEDLRFVEIEMTEWVFDEGLGKRYKTVRILQAYNGHEWFDVPLVKEEK